MAHVRGVLVMMVALSALVVVGCVRLLPTDKPLRVNDLGDGVVVGINTRGYDERTFTGKFRYGTDPHLVAAWSQPGAMVGQQLVVAMSRRQALATNAASYVGESGVVSLPAQHEGVKLIEHGLGDQHLETAIITIDEAFLDHVVRAGEVVVTLHGAGDTQEQCLLTGEEVLAYRHLLAEVQAAQASGAAVDPYWSVRNRTAHRSE
ncbi:MAG: hypothetical protein ACYTF0_07515 [Planctomycetota bacterium]|jgi:hypothetical protein